MSQVDIQKFYSLIDNNLAFAIGNIHHPAAMDGLSNSCDLLMMAIESGLKPRQENRFDWSSGTKDFHLRCIDLARSRFYQIPTEDNKQALLGSVKILTESLKSGYQTQY